MMQPDDGGISETKAKRIKLPSSKRARIKLALAAVGFGVVLPLPFVLSSDSTGTDGGFNFAAKAQQRLPETANEITIAQGAQPSLEGKQLIHMPSPNQKIFLNKAAKFSANPTGRILNLPVGKYAVYVKYEGDDLKFAKLMNCATTVKFETYCPTGKTVTVDNAQKGPVDVTSSLLETYSGPPGLKNRQLKNLYDTSFNGKLWKKDVASDLSTLRFYPR